MPDYFWIMSHQSKRYGGDRKSVLRQLAFKHGSVGGWPADLWWVESSRDGDFHTLYHTILEQVDELACQLARVVTNKTAFEHITAVGLYDLGRQEVCRNDAVRV